LLLRLLDGGFELLREGLDLGSYLLEPLLLARDGRLTPGPGALSLRAQLVELALDARLLALVGVGLAGASPLQLVLVLRRLPPAAAGATPCAGGFGCFRSAVISF